MASEDFTERLPIVSFLRRVPSAGNQAEMDKFIRNYFKNLGGCDIENFVRRPSSFSSGWDEVVVTFSLPRNHEFCREIAAVKSENSHWHVRKRLLWMDILGKKPIEGIYHGCFADKAFVPTSFDFVEVPGLPEPAPEPAPAPAPEPAQVSYANIVAFEPTSAATSEQNVDDLIQAMEQMIIDLQEQNEGLADDLIQAEMDNQNLTEQLMASREESVVTRRIAKMFVQEVMGSSE